MHTLRGVEDRRRYTAGGPGDAPDPSVVGASRGGATIMINKTKNTQLNSTQLTLTPPRELRRMNFNGWTDLALLLRPRPPPEYLDRRSLPRLYLCII